MAHAMMLGEVIGFERELKNRPTWFRTRVLVTGAGAIFAACGRTDRHRLLILADSINPTQANGSCKIMV